LKFDTDMDYALEELPWFWGSVVLFMIPWFAIFDANTMVVSKMSVWVKLHNLALYFWHHKVLEGIGNSLGKFLNVDAHGIRK